MSLPDFIRILTLHYFMFLVCRECGEEFRSRFGFREHRMRHKEEDNYKCMICGKLAHVEVS